MAKSVITPTVKTSPVVVRWDMTSVGEDEAHEVGHNLTVYTIIYVVRSGSATVKMQVSPDGVTYVDLPNSSRTLTAPAVDLIQVNMSVRSIKPVIASGTSPNVSVYLSAVRP